MALRDPEAGASPLALFGAELRHYRTAAGLSQEQLGDRIGYSAALVGAVETARRMPTEDFTARCDVVGELGTGGALARLRAHLRDQLHRQVWPPWFREWPSIEREALSLRSWELAVIPGLLQTADYARAMLRGALPDATDEEVEQQVDARMERQQILARQDPPMLWAIMDEAALRRPVGGARIDACPTRRISSKRPRIPRSRCWSCQPRPALTSGVLGLSSSPNSVTRPMSCTWTRPRSGQIADHPDIVKACDQIFDTLRAEALPPRASLDLIAEVRDIWT